MELKKLQISHRHSCPQSHSNTISGSFGRISGHGIKLPGTTGSQQNHFCPNFLQIT
jgi:hypothetical protein